MEKKQISLSVFLSLARWLSWRVSVWVFVFTYPGGCLCVFLTTRLCVCVPLFVFLWGREWIQERNTASQFAPVPLVIDGLCCGWVTRIEVYLTKKLCLGQWGAMFRPCFSVPRSWRRGHWTEFDRASAISSTHVIVICVAIVGLLIIILLVLLYRKGILSKTSQNDNEKDRGSHHRLDVQEFE